MDLTSVCGSRDAEIMETTQGRATSSVPDRRSQDLEVVVERRTINLGAGNWNGEGMGGG